MHVLARDKCILISYFYEINIAEAQILSYISHKGSHLPFFLFHHEWTLNIEQIINLKLAKNLFGQTLWLWAFGQFCATINHIWWWVSHKISLRFYVQGLLVSKSFIKITDLSMCGKLRYVLLTAPEFLIYIFLLLKPAQISHKSSKLASLTQRIGLYIVSAIHFN